jgi:hypothetical protein
MAGNHPREASRPTTGSRSKDARVDGLGQQNFFTHPQIVTSKGRGGRRYPPYAFTEQGVAMLSTVLASPTPILVNVQVMRAFVRLRQMLGAHAELAARLDALERKYDPEFKVVFDAIRELMVPDPRTTRRIGFRSEDESQMGTNAGTPRRS